MISELKMNANPTQELRLKSDSQKCTDSNFYDDFTTSCTNWNDGKRKRSNSADMDAKNGATFFDQEELNQHDQRSFYQ